MVAMATSLENSKIEVRFRSSSTAIAEPNGENRVKIRPVEVEIIGLTEIVKKIIKYRSKTYGYPVATYAGTAWPNKLQRNLPKI